MNWTVLRPYVLGFSIGLNVAFVGIWLFHTLPLEMVSEPSPGPRTRSHSTGKKDPGWWFYHKKIGVSDTQWQKIKPDLKAFHHRAYELCRELGTLRNRLLDLLSEPVPDESAIGSLNDRILSLRRKKQLIMIDYFRGKKDLLTTTQQERFFDALRKKPRCWKHARFLDTAMAEKLPDIENQHKQEP